MTLETTHPAAAPSGRVPLWLVLEDALAGSAVVAEWAAAQRGPAPVVVPEPRTPQDLPPVPSPRQVRITNIVLVLFTVAVLLVAAVTVGVVGTTA